MDVRIYVLIVPVCSAASDGGCCSLITPSFILETSIFTRDWNTHLDGQLYMCREVRQCRASFGYELSTEVA